jgi:hypothetical protein
VAERSWAVAELRARFAAAGGVVFAGELDVVGTSGQLYHHLRPLLGAGWLCQAARGRYEVPHDRVVPLLVVVAATGR